MKNSQIIIIAIFIILFGILIVRQVKKPEVETITPPVVVQTPDIRGCYVAYLAKDVYTLNVQSQTGADFTGTLQFKNFEKDSSYGTYVGTYKDDILLGEYAFTSEGMDSLMQVIFKKVPEGFVRGFGTLETEGREFEDLSKVQYDNKVIFKSQPCTQ